MDNLENNKRLNITMNFSLEPNEHQIKLSSKTDFFHDELTESEAKLLFANVVKLFIDTVKSDRIKLEYVDEDLDEKNICNELFESADVILNEYYTEKIEED